MNKVKEIIVNSICFNVNSLQDSKESKSDSHSKWDLKQPYEGEYDEGGDEVVGLVVDQVVDHPVRPPTSVVGVGHLKPLSRTLIRWALWCWKQPMPKSESSTNDMEWNEIFTVG